MSHRALGANRKPPPFDADRRSFFENKAQRQGWDMLKQLSRSGIVRYYIALIEPLLFFLHDGCDTLRSMLTRFNQCGYLDKCVTVSILKFVAMSA